MSDTADSSTSPAPRGNGRFAKGNPGGPGRPRGSANRRPAAPPIVFVVAPEPGRDDDSVQLDHRRRIAAIEATMRDLRELERRRAESRQNGFQRFSDGFRRFLSGRRARKSPKTKASSGSTDASTV